jgi:TonB family protein
MRHLSTAIFLMAGLCAPPAAAMTRDQIDDCLTRAVESHHPKGNAQFTFRRQDDTSITDLAIDVTSGDEALDNTAMECLRDLKVEQEPSGPAWSVQVVLTMKSGGHPKYNQLYLTPPPESGKPSAPRSIGKAHVCVQYYPPEAVAGHVQGITTLNFRITAQGTVAGPIVVNSSGSQALDDAALVCVREWEYRPAMLEGKAIEILWKAEVRWALH